MKFFALATFAAGAIFVAAGAGHAADAPPAKISPAVTVRVEGIKQAGTLKVGLYDEASFPTFALFTQTATARAGQASVTFEHLPPGDYAVIAYLDVNGNGKADAGEPKAVSNGASGSDFAAAAIATGLGASTVTLQIR